MTDMFVKPKRFYKQVSVEQTQQGFAITLDGRVPKTPEKHALVLPTHALATLVASEWENQNTVIDLLGMPLTRLANVVIDRLDDTRSRVEAELLRFFQTDALISWSDTPPTLLKAQETQWGPWLHWLREETGIALVPTTALVPDPLSAAAQERFSTLVESLTPWALAALAHLAALYGSFVLALAVSRGALSAEDAFGLSTLEERFQEDQWGADDEAVRRRAALNTEAGVFGGWLAAL